MAAKKYTDRPNPAEESVLVGIGWYTPGEWLKLMRVSADAHDLEETYEGWLAGVERTMRILKEQGQATRRVMVDVDSLVAWCAALGKTVNGPARAEFVAERLRLSDEG